MKLNKYLCKNDCPKFLVDQSTVPKWCPFCQSDNIAQDDVLEVRPIEEVIRDALQVASLPPMGTMEERES